MGLVGLVDPEVVLGGAGAQQHQQQQQQQQQQQLLLLRRQQRENHLREKRESLCSDLEMLSFNYIYFINMQPFWSLSYHTRIILTRDLFNCFNYRYSDTFCKYEI